MLLNADVEKEGSIGRRPSDVSQKSKSEPSQELLKAWEEEKEAIRRSVLWCLNSWVCSKHGTFLSSATWPSWGGNHDVKVGKSVGI